MKKTLQSLLAAAAMATPLAPSLSAAINPAIVPSGSKWVAYADFNAMRESALGERLLAVLKEQKLLEVESANSPILPDIPKIMAAIGTVTAYGDSLSGKPEEMDGALVIQGNDTKLRAIAEGIVAHFLLNDPDHIVELTDLPFEAYRVHGEIVVGFPSEPIIVVSRSTKSLSDGLAAFRGQGDTLAKKPGALGDMLPKENNYYFYGASVMPSVDMGDGNTPQARILKMTQAAALSLGEVDGNVMANANLIAADKDTAQRLTKIVNGMTALLSLAQSEEADLVAFIDSVKVQQTDRRVGVRMGYPAAKLIALVESQVNREEHEREAARRRAEARFTVDGDVIAEWKSDEDNGPAVEGLDAGVPVTHTTAPVALQPGMVLNFNAIMPGNERARIDYVDIVPVDAGSGERFELEFMRLTNARIVPFEGASGAEVVLFGTGRGLGRAQLVFRGAAGQYRFKMGYLKDSESPIHFKVSAQAPGTSSVPSIKQ